MNRAPSSVRTRLPWGFGKDPPPRGVLQTHGRHDERVGIPVEWSATGIQGLRKQSKPALFEELHRFQIVRTLTSLRAGLINHRRDGRLMDDLLCDTPQEEALDPPVAMGGDRQKIAGPAGVQDLFRRISLLKAHTSFDSLTPEPGRCT